MALESLLKPVKWVDEQILREYTKLAQKGESKGIGKYALATGLNGVAKLFLMPAWFISSLNGDNASFGIALGASVENTFELIVYNEAAFKAEELETHSRVKDQFVEKMKSIYSGLRLPILAGAASQIGMGVANLYNYFAEGDASALPMGIQQMVLGTGLLSWSSAMYVRDSDPKLLQKDPFWKRAYSWAKERLDSLTPEPAPQPVPVHTYTTLENYVQAQPHK
jgi:hypothetical protein